MPVPETRRHIKHKDGKNGYKTSALVAKEVLRVERVQDAKKTSSSVMSLEVVFLCVRVLNGCVCMTARHFPLLFSRYL